MSGNGGHLVSASMCYIHWCLITYIYISELGYHSIGWRLITFYGAGHYLKPMVTYWPIDPTDKLQLNFNKNNRFYCNRKLLNCRLKNVGHFVPTQCAFLPPYANYLTWFRPVINNIVRFLISAASREWIVRHALQYVKLTYLILLICQSDFPIPN